MKPIPYIEIKDYQYELPEKAIAKYPLPERDASKLLVYKNGKIETSQYKFLAEFLPENATLVFNNTKVVEARLQFSKPTGGQIEIFCLEPFDENEDIIVAMQTTGKVNWKCLIGGAKKWKSGNLEKNIATPNGNVLLQACKKEQSNETGVYVIEFIWNNDSLSFAEILHYAGIIPLPPYLNRETEKEDAVRYQTVYAQKDGSVAAPTAGLHFTTRLMNELQQKGIKEVYITLHVGAGTFKPVKANNIAQHEMHAEFIDVQKNTIVHLLQQINAPIVAVGTTSLRTLESLYWIGVKIHEWFQIHRNYNELNDLHVEQWAPYQLNNNSITASEALQAILYWMDAKGTERLITKTSIIIVPGYTFKIIKGLITNFHQPQSTLLLLIAAIIGSEWKKVYQFALNNNFRFLSYGDGSLLWL
ncbi:S-adenosylmethionine:tRNA ribosyltransferase-isomerase [Hydrotalea sandarakina]|jgi:S-adenosylmethionine:tRNA ribosyltransferase-isomerase|uniref:S-adenosylmethionine:tRNA ribosyltransferase-isomerase n=1 Tax=Hydrotalea sandarakina TaxID=1004304 RepID=A0A2W7S970_9BACT|nr:S-adenosylmethionine:tRNA ribosyltransferase-isomerase [Hydrotalea sandarakina]PZX63637.1 S-adenosylmethionine:tRNA ribosyltransferase-isomerase [Hydrotalea sandarakina]